LMNCLSRLVLIICMRMHLPEDTDILTDSNLKIHVSIICREVDNRGKL